MVGPLLAGSSRQRGASAANVVEEGDAVELDVDLLDLPLARIFARGEDGDSPDGGDVDAEVDGPDQGDVFAVEGFEGHVDGEEIGLFFGC